MHSNNIRKLLNNFKEDFPEKVFSLGFDFDLTNDATNKIVYISEQFYLSENITEERALERAIKFCVKEFRGIK